jgi:hypothetical protein
MPGTASNWRIVGVAEYVCTGGRVRARFLLRNAKLMRL